MLCVFVFVFVLSPLSQHLQYTHLPRLLTPAFSFAELETNSPLGKKPYSVGRAPLFLYF